MAVPCWTLQAAMRRTWSRTFFRGDWTWQCWRSEAEPSFPSIALYRYVSNHGAYAVDLRAKTRLNEPDQLGFRFELNEVEPIRTAYA